MTALAALLQLGPDYRFVTNFETDAKLSNNTLTGDLVIRFSGDPTLTRQQIRNMANALKQLGIHKVDGDLVVDISAFTSHDKAPGWVWNDMTQCFSAPPLRLSLTVTVFQFLFTLLKKQEILHSLRRLVLPCQYVQRSQNIS